MKEEIPQLGSLLFQSLLLQVLWMKKNHCHHLTCLIGPYHQSAPVTTISKMKAGRKWRRSNVILICLQ